MHLPRVYGRGKGVVHEEEMELPAPPQAGSAEAGQGSPRRPSGEKVEAEAEGTVV